MKSENTAFISEIVCLKLTYLFVTTAEWVSLTGKTAPYMTAKDLQRAGLTKKVKFSTFKELVEKANYYFETVVKTLIVFAILKYGSGYLGFESLKELISATFHIYAVFVQGYMLVLLIDKFSI